MSEISKDFYFGYEFAYSSVQKHKKLLKYYESTAEKVIDLKVKIPIFLDTNVILRYYKISFTKRKMLLGFFRKHKNQIILSNEVQNEYLRNRENDIFNYTKKLTSTFIENYSNSINSIKKFIEEEALILDDFDYLQSYFEIGLRDFKKNSKKLEKDLASKKMNSIKLHTKDSMLNFVASLKKSKTLKTEEIKFIEKKYDDVKKRMKDVKEALQVPRLCIPGISDYGKDYPYGDYIIFHEMMKYSKTTNSDIVFLTFEKSKGDLIRKNSKPHLHYLDIFHNLTGQHIYILDADRFLERHLKIEVDEISKPKVKSKITIESLRHFLANHPNISNRHPALNSSLPSLVRELSENGINSLSELENRVKDSDEIVTSYENQILKRPFHFNQVGYIRFVLKSEDLNK